MSSVLLQPMQERSEESGDWNLIPTNPTELLRLIQRSELLTSNRFAEIAQLAEAIPSGRSSRELASKLLANRLITNFQCNELLSGRLDRLYLRQWILLKKLSSRSHRSTDSDQLNRIDTFLGFNPQTGNVETLKCFYTGVEYAEKEFLRASNISLSCFAKPTQFGEAEFANRRIGYLVRPFDPGVSLFSFLRVNQIPDVLSLDLMKQFAELLAGLEKFGQESALIDLSNVQLQDDGTITLLGLGQNQSPQSAPSMLFRFLFELITLLPYQEKRSTQKTSMLLERERTAGNTDLVDFALLLLGDPESDLVNDRFRALCDKAVRCSIPFDGHQLSLFAPYLTGEFPELPTGLFRLSIEDEYQVLSRLFNKQRLNVLDRTRVADAGPNSNQSGSAIRSIPTARQADPIDSASQIAQPMAQQDGTTATGMVELSEQRNSSHPDIAELKLLFAKMSGEVLSEMKREVHRLASMRHPNDPASPTNLSPDVGTNGNLGSANDSVAQFGSPIQLPAAKGDVSHPNQHGLLHDRSVEPRAKSLVQPIPRDDASGHVEQFANKHLEEIESTEEPNSTNELRTDREETVLESDTKPAVLSRKVSIQERLNPKLKQADTSNNADSKSVSNEADRILRQILDSRDKSKDEYRTKQDAKSRSVKQQPNRFAPKAKQDKQTASKVPDRNNSLKIIAGLVIMLFSNRIFWLIGVPGVLAGYFLISTIGGVFNFETKEQRNDRMRNEYLAKKASGEIGSGKSKGKSATK